MKNPLKIASWALSDNPYKKGKYVAWKYETFGQGSGIYRPVSTYDAIDQIAEDKRMLPINDPVYVAGVGSVVTEMNGLVRIRILVPYTAPETQEEAKVEIEQRQQTAIARFAGYYQCSERTLTDLVNEWTRIINPN